MIYDRINLAISLQYEHYESYYVGIFSNVNEPCGSGIWPHGMPTTYCALANSPAESTAVSARQGGQTSWNGLRSQMLFSLHSRLTIMPFDYALLYWKRDLTGQAYTHARCRHNQPGSARLCFQGWIWKTARGEGWIWPHLLVSLQAPIPGLRHFHW